MSISNFDKKWVGSKPLIEIPSFFLCLAYPKFLKVEQKNGLVSDIVNLIDVNFTNEILTHITVLGNTR